MKFPGKVSRESFTKFHQVSQSFNKRGKMIKTVLHFSFVNFQSIVDPNLALVKKILQNQYSLRYRDVINLQNSKFL